MCVFGKGLVVEGGMKENIKIIYFLKKCKMKLYIGVALLSVSRP